MPTLSSTVVNAYAPQTPEGQWLAAEAEYLQQAGIIAASLYDLAAQAASQQQQAGTLNTSASAQALAVLFGGSPPQQNGPNAGGRLAKDGQQLLDVARKYNAMSAQVTQLNAQVQNLQQRLAAAGITPPVTAGGGGGGALPSNTSQPASGPGSAGVAIASVGIVVGLAGLAWFLHRRRSGH